MSILKLISILLITACLSLTQTKIVLADNEFETAFHSNYIVSESGLTKVNHQISITNKLSHLYTTEYTIFISSSNLKQIKVTQDNKPIQFVSKQSGSGTNISLKKLTPVIGQGKTTHLKISYQTSDIVETLNQTWSINIPRLSKANEASEFIRTITVPATLGLPNAQYPEATSMVTDKYKKQTTLTYKGYPSQSLSILFGKSEYYHLNLTYQIKNPTLTSADTEIALPPDTAYQKVILDKLEPSPQSIRVDDDGNWLAIYNLEAGQNLQITASLYLEVFALPQSKQSLNTPESLLTPLQFWDVKNPALINLANQLKTPLNIYNYLIDNLIYDYSRLKNNPDRLGSLKAYQNPTSALCTEYTDLFVTLNRILKIPAREINGYAYTTNTSLRPLGVATADILHAWPEYYDKNTSTWIQVDPTWGQTTGGIDYFHKLDFNHLTFVIHGRESTYPLPAGAYKTDPKLATIKVELVDKLPNIIHNLDIKPSEDKVVVTNLGNASLTHDKYGYLPPYGQLQLKTSTSQPNPKLKTIYLYPTIFLVIIVVIVIFLKYRQNKKH